MLASIKKQEIKNIESLKRAGRLFEMRWYIAEILAAHGCSYETHVISPDGFIIDISPYLKKKP